MASSRGTAAAARLTAWRPMVARSHYPGTSGLSTTPECGRMPKAFAARTLTNRYIHAEAPRGAQAAVSIKRTQEGESYAKSQGRDSSSNPALSFPCLDALEAKSASLSARSLSSGPEPSYTTGRHEEFTSTDLLLLDWGGVLPEFTIAYETWGTLNNDKSNAILLHTGLSASSHAHSTKANPKPGWWERFIGPGAPLDTDKYFVICTNVLGGCFGSTGPSSIDPSDGKRYATRFPILTLDDMVRAQFRLLDSLGIATLAASVGSSMGGMQSLAAGVLFPDRVRRIVSISGCARSHPYSIAMRHTQRQVLMMDPKWARGFYYDSIPPHSGMKLAREIATVTYRSGPEWEKRFGRKRADPSKQPALCPDFLIETYLDHAGEKFSLEYDANSLLYVSKAMDLFDLGRAQQLATAGRRAETHKRILAEGREGRGILNDPSCSLTLPEQPYEEQPSSSSSSASLTPQQLESENPSSNPQPQSSQSQSQTQQLPKDLIQGLSPLKSHPILVMGVASDILFPAWQQREIAEALVTAGSSQVEHVELGEDVSLFGHDTFLLDLENIGGRLGRFLM
ncbi:homoserine O-acetyltransferase [Emergomyces pasteurianus Ep9510]|uniref:Homoserine O-acetyltransferase n=1 Tax=Emergomyces pasteurianus Ep9510 TaxID=1447872 RepID=A0A1J9QKH7_9EURO|nr:homoserine O-acetyltransferase [Emergomyces pasteurianus Ep9510]